MLQDTEPLSARVVRSIYHPNSTILQATLGNHPSQIWRAIIEGRDVLKQGLIRRIGNGTTTNIWNDNWIPQDEMLRSYGSRVPNPPVMVSELIDATSATWNFQSLHEVFMPMDIPAIMGIPLCTRNVEDYWGWHFERSGVFTVKSAIECLWQRN